jgi:hypothetical protein
MSNAFFAFVSDLQLPMPRPRRQSYQLDRRRAQPRRSLLVTAGGLDVKSDRYVLIMCCNYEFSSSLEAAIFSFFPNIWFLGFIRVLPNKLHVQWNCHPCLWNDVDLYMLYSDVDCGLIPVVCSGVWIDRFHLLVNSCSKKIYWWNGQLCIDGQVPVNIIITRLVYDSSF